MDLKGVKDFINRPITGEENALGRFGRWVASAGAATVAVTSVVNVVETYGFHQTLTPEMTEAYMTEAAVTLAGLVAWIYGRQENEADCYQAPFTSPESAAEEAA